MGLMDRLREAEQSGRDAARMAFGKAKEFGGDAQRRMRQKMRIYPTASASPSEVSQSNPAGATPSQSEGSDMRSLEASPQQPIISVNGEDVEHGKLGGSRRAA